MSLINDFIITDLINLEAYKRNTGELDFRLTDLQNLDLNAAQEKKALTGRNGRVIAYKKRNKTLSGKGKNATVSAGLMKAQTGGALASGTQTVKKSECKKVSGGTLATDAPAIGTEGAEIGVIKVITEDGRIGDSYTQAAAADASHFSYSEGVITLPTSGGEPVIPDGTALIYSYERNVNGTRLTDPNDKFSEVREIWIHCLGRDTCDREYFASVYIPRADFSGSFSLNLGGDQVVHDFSFDAMADMCDPSRSSDLFELIIYTD